MNVPPAMNVPPMPRGKSPSVEATITWWRRVTPNMENTNLGDTVFVTYSSFHPPCGEYPFGSGNGEDLACTIVGVDIVGQYEADGVTTIRNGKRFLYSHSHDAIVIWNDEDRKYIEEHPIEIEFMYPRRSTNRVFTTDVVDLDDDESVYFDIRWAVVVPAQ